MDVLISFFERSVFDIQHITASPIPMYSNKSGLSHTSNGNHNLTDPEKRLETI